MQIVKAGMLYFALVFGAGFVFGTIRVLCLVPRLGTRIAELIETPFMFGVIVVAAQWVAKRLAIPPKLSRRLAMGFVALSLLVFVEFTLVLWLQRVTIRDYFASRNPVAGTVYIAMLGVFTIMPILVARK